LKSFIDSLIPKIIEQFYHEIVDKNFQEQRKSNLFSNELYFNVSKFSNASWMRNWKFSFSFKMEIKFFELLVIELFNSTNVEHFVRNDNLESKIVFCHKIWFLEEFRRSKNLFKQVFSSEFQTKFCHFDLNLLFSRNIIVINRNWLLRNESWCNGEDFQQFTSYQLKLKAN
jgi:hypothetical protein